MASSNHNSASNGVASSTAPSTTDTRLQGRIAVITGSSSGLGRAMAIKFANAGARIVCADLRPEARPMAADKQPPTPTHELINQTHDKESAIFVKTDATDEAAIQATIAKAVEWGGRLDIICNNAGTVTPNTISS